MSTSNDQVARNVDYDWMDRERFLKEYTLKLALEFSQDGQPAEWAHNGHRYWDCEDDSIELELDDKDKNDEDSDGSAALSADNRFLAVSSNTTIRLYDIKSKEVVSRLHGHEENVRRMSFAPQAAATSGGGPARAYTLVSSDRHMYPRGNTFIWHLNEQGAHLGPSMMLTGELPIFGLANPVSNDGKQVITVEKNESSQHGMRPAEEMPRIVLRNLDTLAEEWRLTGHQDTITWAGWSPDNKWVAESSWDQTYGIWNPKVKNRAEGHLIGPSDGQNWVGDFSADGRYIVFSGGSPTKVAVYEVASGNEIASLEAAKGSPIKDWVRELKWSPVDYSVAVIDGKTVLIWRPLEGNTATCVFEVETDGTMLTRYNRLLLVKWADEGRKLMVRDTADTVFVWDVKANKKWRFQRPDGVPLPTYLVEVFYVRSSSEDEGTILSVDDDWKVRCWNL